MSYRPGDPRNTRRYRKVAKLVLAASDRCWICKRHGANTVDHVVPIALGGNPYDPANMRPAHRKCNSRRGANLPKPALRGASREW